MRHIALLLLTIAVAQASVTVTRTSNDGPQPSTMEIEVQLPNSNKAIRIPLTKTNAFENVPMTVVENGVSRTFSAHQVHHASHSHYRDIESKSVISVRHVNGKRRISGHVMHEGTSYFLEPIGDSEHRVTKNIMKPDAIAKQVDRKVLKVQSRRKRQSLSSAPTTNVVEILLLLDHTVWDAFKSIYSTEDKATTELHYYYTHILNGIDTAYRNIGTVSISISCIGITIAKTAADDAWMPPAGSADADQAATILSYMKTYSVGKAADHVMAFTRTDIKSGNNSAVCGMAYTSSTCTDSKQSISEDQGMHSWGTASHELAHNLGSEHDGDKNECDTAKKNLMSPMAGSYSLSDVANSYRFSTCTIRYITDYINGLGSNNCLKSSLGIPAVTSLAATIREGARMTLDQVCKLSFPSSAGKLFLSDDISGNPANICAKIYCTTGANSGTTTGGLRAPVGTPCGSQKSCNWNGECTADSAAPVADNTCFWGDSWDAANCQGWLDYINYQRGANDVPGAKGNCNSVFSGCCKSLKTACTFPA